MEPWIIKYRAHKLGDIVGQDTQVKKIRNFLENFKKEKKKSLLLYGPPGCGKTSSVVAAAEELGLEIIEVNASDVRNKDAINEIVGNASKQMSLFAKGKLILVDEIDGVSGKEDRGGAAALVPIIKETKFPIIMTANDGYSDKLKAVRKVSTLVQFNKLDLKNCALVLKRLCEKEGVKFDGSALIKLAGRENGDLRGAINDLETLATENKIIRDENVIESSDRERTDSILQALTTVFKSKDINLARKAFDDVEEGYDKVMNWLDYNLPLEYQGKALMNAFNFLSKSDIYKRRIRRWQHWRFLVYIYALCSAGIAASKEEVNKQFITYKQSDRFLKMWLANNRNAKKKSIANKLALHTHTSNKVAFNNVNYLIPIFRNNEEKANELIEYLELEQDEVDWLMK